MENTHLLAHAIKCLLFICEEVHGSSGNMLIADCHYLHIFLYFKDEEYLTR